ncbi:unnamed protein product [Brachionus calyciflorus]|uniref:Seven cysteines N-terminal domain-containing protein n=1 Tax=Brachionus calyciflorus TaxID=104777 RepID=A0A814G6I2_9BILA|nr:unnamed protein product [Brachionus calyciflorus]
MKNLLYTIVLVIIGLIKTYEQSSFPIKGPEMSENYLHNDQNDPMYFERDKKKDSDTEPLYNHRRKTINPEEQICLSRLNSFDSNRMIDTKKSVDNGARLLSVEKIHVDKEFKLSELQDSCANLCCSTDSCDTGLLSLMKGHDGYRCYMFKCDGHCFFIKHKDYIVLRQKTPEQLNDNLIQTGHSPTGATCHKNYEFTCLSNKQCIPIYDVCDSIPHCDDKSDELNCNLEQIIKTTSKKMSTKTTSKNRINTDDYDDSEYEYDLVKQQNDIIAHLKELEELNSNRFYHKPDFFDSFMKERQTKSKIKLTNSPNNKIRTTKINKIDKPIFHDMEMNVNRINFDDGKEIVAVNKSDHVQAIVILIIGCLLVASFFIYLAVSTKYLSKKLKIISLLKQDKSKGSAQNVDVDGDYLINGLYL